MVESYQRSFTREFVREDPAEAQRLITEFRRFGWELFHRDKITRARSAFQQANRFEAVLKEVYPRG